MFEIYNTLEKNNKLSGLVNNNFFLNKPVIKKTIIHKIIGTSNFHKPLKIKKIYVNIVKPKNQFFFNLMVRKKFSYSTGLILKALELQSRSSRRNKNGWDMFFLFVLRKLESLSINNKSNIYFYLNNLNNFNNIKNFLIKYTILWKASFFFLIKIGKNYNNKKYKKISYINKRLRKRFIIE